MHCYLYNSPSSVLYAPPMTNPVDIKNKVYEDQQWYSTIAEHFQQHCQTETEHYQSQPCLFLWKIGILNWYQVWDKHCMNHWIDK